jgi:hypothetical protein
MREKMVRLDVRLDIIKINGGSFDEFTKVNVIVS